MITKETVDRIVRFHGEGLPVISFYGCVDPGLSRREVHTRMLSLLDQIRPLTRDYTLGRQSRLSVRDDIARISAAVDGERWQPGAVAIFSCSGRDLYEEIPLPRRVREQVIVDATPFARPVLAVLGECRRICVLVIDRASARIWEVDQDEMQEVGTVKDPAPRKSASPGGLAEDRARNKADEVAKRHFRRVAELLEKLLRSDGYDIMIVGGHDYEIPEFLRLLPLELRDRVAGTFSVDPSTVSVAGIRDSASAALDRYRREQEEQLVSAVLEKAAMGGLTAVGLPSCLWAGSVGAVKTLLVQDGAIAPGVVCDESGWLAPEGDACPLCGSPPRRTPDIIDELVAAVIDAGGPTWHVEADTRLSEFLVAAELRFPLPPASAGSQ
jgi:peptide chain release factor subunit 1